MWVVSYLSSSASLLFFFFFFFLFDFGAYGYFLLFLCSQAANQTPVDKEAIRDIDQQLFAGFSFAVARKSSDMAEPVQQNHNVLASFKWYRPDLSRVDAVRSLKVAPKGAFVVRESGSQPGCFALHLSLGDGKCYHGLITLVHRVDGTLLYKVTQRQSEHGGA